MVYQMILEDYQCAIEAAESDYQLNLDDPREIFLRLEEIIGQEIKILKNEGGNYLNLKRRAQIWGVFLGEMIRYRLGGYWLAVQPELVLSVFRREFRPVLFVRERFEGVCQVSVPDYYLDLVVEIKANLDQAGISSGDAQNPDTRRSVLDSRSSSSVGIKELLVPGILGVER